MPPGLEAQARNFAAHQSTLLNRTIVDGIRLSAVVATQRDVRPTVAVARGITKTDLIPKVIPLTLRRRKAGLFLRAAYVLELDPEEEHLAVTKSEYSLYSDDSATSLLAHWDYEREPTHPYPPAHFQVEGESDVFAQMVTHARESLGRACPERPLRDLHFPVGGRRFRPTLEDVIEFLILEELVDHKDSWRAAVDEGRADWEAHQLGAAIRRNPEMARAALRDLDSRSVRDVHP